MLISWLEVSLDNFNFLWDALLLNNDPGILDDLPRIEAVFSHNARSSKDSAHKLRDILAEERLVLVRESFISLLLFFQLACEFVLVLPIDEMERYPTRLSIDEDFLQDFTSE